MKAKLLVDIKADDDEVIATAGTLVDLLDILPDETGYVCTVHGDESELWFTVKCTDMTVLS